ncbi:MAG: protein phosphatase 2C domain-containing protein [Patescibacteria group bacterium]
MGNQFESAAGSIMGTDHRQQFVWKNNQDALVVREEGDCTIAVVSDGCGEGAYSELGARLTAHLTVNRLAQIFATGQTVTPAVLDDLLEGLRMSLLLSLQPLAMEMERGSRAKAVLDHFLFTLLALVVTPVTTYVIGIGDGIYAINGEVVQIGPFPENKPPYLAYGGLLKSTISPELVRFTVHKTIPTAELTSALIGTDGVGDLDRAASKTLPGRKELVGPLSQFWVDDRYFKNPEGIRRRLNLINNSACQTDWKARETTEEHGRLTDDTTLVVVRRRPQPKA